MRRVPVGRLRHKGHAHAHHAKPPEPKPEPVVETKQETHPVAHGKRHHVVHVARSFTVEVILDALGKVLYAVVTTVVTIKFLR